MVHADGGLEPIDPFARTQHWSGLDYHLDIFREIEVRGLLSGRTILIAYGPPRALPRTGPDVVLSILCDEQHLHRRAHREVGAILRCYGAAPPYLDGVPWRSLQRAAALRWSLRSAVSLKHYVQAGADRPPTLHLPIGLCNAFAPATKPVLARSWDYGFLGSVDEFGAGSTLADRIALRPKILARRRMLEAMQRISPVWRGRLGVTHSFQESILAAAAYEAAFAELKVALVPRGASYETYRFFEACKAGSAVICEPLPRAWLYKGHPGLVLRDWTKLPALLEQLLRNPSRLEALSAASLAYWERVVSPEALAAPVASFLARATRPA